MVSPTRNYLQGCEKSFLAIKRKSFGKVEYRVFPAKCHSWDCPVCAKEKARMYRDRMRGLFDGRQLWMLTLTYYHSRPADEVWRDVSIAWNRLRTAAAKRYGRLSYARVLEHHHKSPYPHLHIILDKALEPVWLAAELRSAGFGYQCKMSTITTEGAIDYVTKYLSKPWTSSRCKAYRRIHHLRVISFGGDAVGRCNSVHDWTLVARTAECSGCTYAVDVDISFEYGRHARKLSERVFDAFVHEIYALDNEITLIEAG